jgi:peroxiredoxin
MKKTTLALGVLALGLVGAAGAAFAEAGKSLALGAKAPLADTKLKNAADGKEVTLAKVAAGKKGALVVFTCNNCPFAKAWEERIVALGNTYSKKGVGVLLVNSNDPSLSKTDTLEDTGKRAKDRAMQFPYAQDDKSALARAFGASKTPEAFLFDKDGKLVYHGTIDDNSEDAAKVSKTYLKDALEAVSAGKVPALQETKSMGCGIKFPKVS